MRKELSFPQLEETKLAETKNLIETIAGLGLDDSEEQLAKLSQITGKEHDPMDFAEYWGWTDLETLAKEALLPEPPIIPDLNKAEVAELVELIKESMISGEDDRFTYYEELLHRSLHVVDVSRYIMSDEPTEQIVEKLFYASKNDVIVL